MSSSPAGLDLSGVDLTTETIRTERLVLRPFRSDDEDAVFRACQDDEIQRWLKHPVPPERTEGRGLSVAMADGVLVGSGGAHLLPGLLGPGVGYWIGGHARGHGYAAEATRGLVAWAFRHGAARVHLFTDVANTASQVVARRAGFTREGVVRSCIPYRDGHRADALLFSRLPGD